VNLALRKRTALRVEILAIIVSFFLKRNTLHHGKILKYNPNADRRELEQKIRNLEKSKSDNNIAVAVVPGDDDELYYSLKRLLPRNTQVPLQIITKPSFEKILSGRFRGSENLCLQILIKNLKKGEAIWKLSNAAGLSKEKTLFVGLGFSRYPREKKVSKCAAVLHDAHGDRITWEVFSTLQERTITKQWFDTLLFRIRDIIDQEKPSRLVFYRTGIMHDTELTAVENSLKERQWSSQIKVSFVSILEVGNFRFYLYDRKSNNYKNLPAGYAIVVNDKEAFLSSSNYDGRELRQGTVIPIRLRLDIGDENIIDILKEYHDLTYLNWPVPRTTAKHPLVITIADRFSELTRENVSIESMFYLDL
jgi:argonaute-like protein implicated in RNA metabolism and viral defense